MRNNLQHPVNCETGELNPPKPSEGTTPQAERSYCPSCGYTKEDADFHLDHHLCNLSGKAPWEARAVAPVETPSNEVRFRERLKKLSFLITGNDYAFLSENPQIEEALKVYVENVNEDATECAPVETRLTARAFWPNWKPAKLGSPTEISVPRSVVYQFAEAFRDKSESELREELKSSEEIRSAEKKILLAEIEKNTGLREEIERLQGELLIHGDLKQYRFRGMTFDELTRKLFRLVDAEAELAALRERERWIPVEEKLPPERGFYVVFPGRKLGHAEVFYYTLDGFWIGPDAEYPNQTHWKALSPGPALPTNLQPKEKQ